MYLLDTNVISELRRPWPHEAVLAWIAQTPPQHIFVSVVTVGEIQAGIEKAREQDEIKAAVLESWLDEILVSYQVLPMDVPAFRMWARLKHGKSANLNQDAMIAATALVHGLTVVTRNVRDFSQLGVEWLNPFEM